ncbi:alanine racemase [Sansalvadorimonas verongulae]|uniref:alanine racemase n=1 Tax=Sansalvadorimonas verongulae TaxID=2172824 RepID=UPI0012BBF3E7|nr:alanine racemase [Sansalvadorimonas verongulae]MTI14741.1 hypothetical protein [Sansalvadorimonas verongulae]
MKLLLFVAVATFFYWRRDCGRPHSLYFQKLQSLLRKHGVGYPRLVIDLDKLDANIQQVKNVVGDTSVLRIPAKSLPSFELLEYLQKQLNTSRLMVFHQPFLNQLLERFPEGDFLIGKPFPVSCARTVLDTQPEVGSGRVKWLIDTYERLEQYIDLAKEKQLCLKLAVEIDVGLHRGGVQTTGNFLQLLKLIAANKEHVSFAGLMGYEPHISKLSGLLASLRIGEKEKVMERYQAFVDVVKHSYPDFYAEGVCFNSGGSMTYSLYGKLDRKGHRGEINDLAVGSAFVKPASFDLETLTHHQAAVFIATPVLKALDTLNVPLLEKVSGLWKTLSPNFGRVFFTYGGWWKARLESPKGLRNNVLYGRSTNQELLTGSEATGLNVDDFIFMRPTQSEYVFLQFGRILVVRKDEVVGEWATFNLDY